MLFFKANSEKCHLDSHGTDDAREFVCGKGARNRSIAQSLVSLERLVVVQCSSKGEWVLVVVVQFMVRSANAGNPNESKGTSGSGWKSKNRMNDYEWCG